MKNRIFVILLSCIFTGMIYSQNTDSNIEVGDVFTIEKVENNDYDHIYFPRPNFIIKKGGIVNYKNVIGENVEITSIKKKKDGQLVATIKLTSRKSFFNSHKYLKVDIKEAINKKELLKV